MTSFHLHSEVAAGTPRLGMVHKVVLGLLALALVVSSLSGGGMNEEGLRWSLVLIAASALLYWIATPARELAPPVPGLLAVLSQVLAGLLALQIIPLPLFLIRFVSAARARLFEPLVAVMPTGCCASLSLAPFLTLQHISRLIAWALVLLVVRELTWKLKSHRWMAIAPVIGLGAFQAALGCLQYAADPSKSIARGTYLNRNHFAGFLEMCLPFAILYSWEIVRRHYRRREPFPAKAALQLCAMLVLTGAILISSLRSLSRMGALSMLISLLLMAALAMHSLRSRLSLPTASLVLLALGVISVLVLAPDRLFQRFSNSSPADQPGVYDVRQLIWRDTLKMVADYPIAGAGYGAFASAFPRYQQVTPNAAVEFAHNDYLQWLAELGFPGVLVMIALLVTLFAEAWHAALPREGGDPAARRLALACTAALAALLVHSFGDYNLQVPANAMTFAWIAGVGSGIDPRLRFSRTRSGRFSAFSATPRVRSVAIYPSKSA